MALYRIVPFRLLIQNISPNFFISSISLPDTRTFETYDRLQFFELFPIQHGILRYSVTLKGRQY